MRQLKLPSQSGVFIFFVFVSFVVVHSVKVNSVPRVFVFLAAGHCKKLHALVNVWRCSDRP